MNADTARAIMPTGYGWEPYRTLSNDERYAQWAQFYFGHGHHRARNDSTATTPAGDTDANRQDCTPAPLPQQQPRGAAIADAAQTETLEEYSRGECLTGWYTQEIDV